VLVAVALIVVALLVFGPSRGGSGSTIGGPTTAGTGPVAETLRAAAFDPFGGDGEDDVDAFKAVDGDPATAWSTEGYVSRTFGTKPGVGLAIALPANRSIRSITIDSPTNDWSVQVFVADGVKSSLDAWGSPVGQKSGIPAGKSTIDLKGAQGSAVLVWITDLGDEGGNRIHVRIAEVSLSAK